jgi:hypothetical protein
MIQHFSAAFTRASQISRIRPTWACAVVIVFASVPAASQGGYIYVANDGAGTVGLFTTEGEAVNPNLITGLVGVRDVKVADGFLYVSSFGPGSGRVGKYTLLGEPINPALITGLTQPTTVAISGTDLFVNNAGTNRIGKYTTSGATVNTSFITTLAGSANAIAISEGEIYVSLFGSPSRIATYSAETGTVVNENLVPSSGSAHELAISGSDLYVATSNLIRKYTTSGTAVNTSLVTADLGQTFYGVGVLGSELYVSTFYSNSIVGKYTTAGEVIDASLITTDINRPYSIEVVARIPEPSSLALLAVGASLLAAIVLRRFTISCLAHWPKRPQG